MQVRFFLLCPQRFLLLEISTARHQSICLQWSRSVWSLLIQIHRLPANKEKLPAAWEIHSAATRLESQIPPDELIHTHPGPGPLFQNVCQIIPSTALHTPYGRP